MLEVENASLCGYVGGKLIKIGTTKISLNYFQLYYLLL